MNQSYARVNQPCATFTLVSALREMFGVQLYKNNARALLSRILSILNLDWLQHACSVRGVYEWLMLPTLCMISSWQWHKYDIGVTVYAPVLKEHHSCPVKCLLTSLLRWNCGHLGGWNWPTLHYSFLFLSVVFVTCKCNIGLGNSLLCLSCVCGWDGWGAGWLVGYVYNLLGMVLGLFSFRTFLTIRFSFYAWCRGFKSWLCVFYFLFFSIMLILILCNLCNTDYFESVMGSVVLFCMFSLPPPNPSTGK